MTYVCYVSHQTELIMQVIQQLKNVNASHPGALEEFENISSERQNNTGIGQAIDLAGEQTYMKSAKTTGKYYHLQGSYN